MGSYNQIKGSSYKLPCLLATTNDVNLLSPPTTVDGITTTTNDRILVWKQTTSSQNGIYVVGLGSWTRAVDFSLTDDVFNGTQVYVTQGTTNQGPYYISTSNPITLDTTSLTFIKAITSGTSGTSGSSGTSGVSGSSGTSGTRGTSGTSGSSGSSGVSPVGQVTGSGTANYLARWSSATNIIASGIYDDGSQTAIYPSGWLYLSAPVINIGQSVSMGLSIGQGGGGSMSVMIPTYIYSNLLVTGTITSNSDIIAYGSSDRRLKDNVTNILDPLDKISKIGGYEFDWNDKQITYTGHDIGVIAQEIESVLPELVTTRENGYKAVKYEKIIALLIEGMKEQQKQIDELKKE